MASRINLFPHPPNQSVLSTPTDTASCTALVSLSVQVLHDSSFSPSPLSIRSFYTKRHRILRRSRDSVRPSSAQFVRFPRATPTPLTAAPLSLSVLVGGWFCYLVPLVHLRLCNPAVFVRPGLGGLLLIPGSPHAPPTLLSLSVLVGGVVLTRPPSRTPDSVVVPILPAKSNSLRGFQPKCPL